MSSRRPVPDMTPPDALATRPDPVLRAADRYRAARPASPRRHRPDRRTRTGQVLGHLPRLALRADDLSRLDFLIGTIFRFLPMVTTVLLWQAIYVGSGKKGSDLAGYRYNEMIAYLLLTHISRMFSSMPNLAAGIAREVREGTLKRYLLQPMDMIGYLLSYRVAHKVAYIVTSFLPYALLFYICREFLRPTPGRDDVRGLCPLADPGLPGRLLLRGQRGHGRLLVPRGDVAAVHRDDAQLLHLGPDAAAGPAAAAVVGPAEGPAVPVHGLFPGGGLPGQGEGVRTSGPVCWPSCSGRSHSSS